MHQRSGSNFPARERVVWFGKLTMWSSRRYLISAKQRELRLKLRHALSLATLALLAVLAPIQSEAHAIGTAPLPQGNLPTAIDSAVGLEPGTAQNCFAGAGRGPVVARLGAAAV